MLCGVLVNLTSKTFHSSNSGFWYFEIRSYFCFEQKMCMQIGTSTTPPKIEIALTDIRDIQQKFEQGFLDLLTLKYGITIIDDKGKKKRQPRPHVRVSQGRHDLLEFVREKFHRCFSHKELTKETFRTNAFIGNVRAITDILRIEKKLFFVVFNNSKKYGFYVLPEFLENPEEEVKRLKEKHFPLKLPNIIASVTVVEGV